MTRRRDRKTSSAAAKYTASPGRVRKAQPIAAPPSTGQTAPPPRTHREIAANARASHIVDGVCAKKVAAWNAKSGDSPTTTTAMIASRRPKWACVA